MAALLSSATSNTTGTGASHSGDCTVWVTGTFDGATVVIQGSNTDSNYGKLDNITIPNPATFKAPGCLAVNAKGTYYLRAVLSGAGSNTSVSVTTTQ